MKTATVFGLCLALAVLGCGAPSDSGSNTNVGGVNVDGSKYLLTAEPEAALDVIKARESTKHDDDVVVLGRIGGGASPWIEGRAAFWIVDRSLKACSDIPGDNCPMPWDYCCQTDLLPTSTALVQVVDDSGELIAADARKLLAVKELSTVVVKGKASRDEEGNLTVLASGIFVKE